MPDDVAKSVMSLNLWLDVSEKNALLPNFLQSHPSDCPSSCHWKALVSRGLKL